METTFVLQLVTYAFVLGVTYILVASGFTLIFSISKILNLAHGEVYCCGALAMYYLYQMAGVNFYLALIIIMFVAAPVGIGIERFFFRPIRGHEAATLIVSLAVGWVLTGSALIMCGEYDRGVESPFSGVVKVLGVGISNERLVIFFVSLALILALYLFIQRHRVGQAMRAVAQDAEAAALMGIRRDRMSALSFAIGFALATLAGALLGCVFVVNPFLGFPALLKCLIVVIIGGLGSIQGVIVGGLLLGFVDSFGSGFLGGVSDIIGFALVILVLVIRPRGLLGHE